MMRVLAMSTASFFFFVLIGFGGTLQRRRRRRRWQREQGRGRRRRRGGGGTAAAFTAFGAAVQLFPLEQLPDAESVRRAVDFEAERAELVGERRVVSRARQPPQNHVLAESVRVGLESRVQWVHGHTLGGGLEKAQPTKARGGVEGRGHDQRHVVPLRTRHFALQPRQRVVALEQHQVPSRAVQPQAAHVHHRAIRAPLVMLVVRVPWWWSRRRRGCVGTKCFVSGGTGGGGGGVIVFVFTVSFRALRRHRYSTLLRVLWRCLAASSFLLVPGEAHQPKKTKNVHTSHRSRL
mmetsp:Transcript_14519/g.29006  ORF Transcript_14519/g.29006 Transcript_14519/m.29006 type:complete len:292 (+) Transcript_14519:453-1328(+)